MSNLKVKISKFITAFLIVLSIGNVPVMNDFVKSTDYVYAASKVKKGTYEGFIERGNFPKYALDFYDSLYENSLDASGYLIDEKNADNFKDGCYTHVITSESGSIDKVSKAAVESIIERKVTSSSIPANCYQTYFAFYFDHPEVFWIEQSPRLKYGYTVTPNKTTGKYDYVITYFLLIKDTNETTKYDIRDTKKYKTTADIIKAINKRDALVKKICKTVKKKDAYQTVCAINKYLVSHNEYNRLVLNEIGGESKYTHQAMCALEGNKGKKGPICMAYSAAFKILCDNLNIPCINVCGEATTANGVTGGHQWNNVKLDDGKWYGIDVTWNDTGKVLDAYLCVGSKTKTADVEFRKSHKVLNKGYKTLTGYKNQPEMSETKYKPTVIRIKLKKKSLKYSGKKLKQSIVVYKNKTKIGKKYYSVTYKNNKKSGRAEVIVKFKKKYKKYGSRRAYFNIVPKNGGIVSIMPFEKSAYIKLAADNNIDGYEIKYSLNNYFNVSNSNTKSLKKNNREVLIEGLKSNKTYYFKVRTYVQKNGKRYYSEYSSLRGVVIN